MGTKETKAWYKGYKQGEESMFEFLEQMEKVKNIKKLKEEYNSWSNADEIKLPNGEIEKRY